ncbi:hypothetical protein HDU97_007325 [Phlyctochytrium planicorne]|nr:hypothetical protein HDU97_007325 [Phlyctochytrium planicorne]
MNVIVGEPRLRMDYIAAGACLSDFGVLLSLASRGTIGVETKTWQCFLERNASEKQLLNGVEQKESGYIVKRIEAISIASRLAAKQSEFATLQRRWRPPFEMEENRHNANVLQKFINASIVFSIDAALVNEFSSGHAASCDCVNQAARLLDVASKDHIIVCDASTVSTATGFICPSIGTFKLKGMQNPVEIFAVDNSPRKAKREEPAKSVIGYSRERSRLLNELDSWESKSKNPLVLTQGPSGIGKSALLHTTRISKESMLTPFSSLRDVLMLAINASTSSDPHVYERQIKRRNSSSTMDGEEKSHFIGVLKSVLTTLNEDPEFYPLFAPIFPSLTSGDTDLAKKLPGAANKGYTEFLFTKVIMYWIRKVPTVLVFDDIQWMDSASQQVLNKLVRFSHEEGTPLGQVAGVDGDVSKGRLVFDDGKKEFVQEFLETSLNQAILSQFDRLSPNLQVFLRHACVCGQYFQMDAVTAALSDGRDLAYWRACIQSEDEFSFLQEDGSEGYFFRHISICNALYESLSFGEQISLHLTYGEFWEQQKNSANYQTSILPFLHFHFFRTNHVEKKIQYSEELGIYYWQSGYHSEAIAIMSALVKLVEEDDTIPSALRPKVRMAHWYALLANSCCISHNFSKGIENALKSLNDCCQMNFPLPQQCGIGSVVRRAIKHVWLLATRRVAVKGNRTEDELNLICHANLALHSLLLLTIAKSVKDMPKTFAVVVLFEMLNSSIGIRDERPVLWIIGAGVTAHVLATVSPKASRMYVDDGLKLLKGRGSFYSSMFVYMSLNAVFAFDGDGRDAVKLLNHFKGNITKKYSSVLRCLNLFDVRCSFPTSLETVESILLNNIDQVIIENGIVGLFCLVAHLSFCIYAGDQNAIDNYLDRITQIIKHTPNDTIGAPQTPEIAVRIWTAVYAQNVEGVLSGLKLMAKAVSSIREYTCYLSVIEAGLLAIWPLFGIMHRKKGLKDMVKLHRNDLKEVFGVAKGFLKAFRRGMYALKNLWVLMAAAGCVLKGRKGMARRVLGRLVDGKEKGVIEECAPQILGMAYVGLWLLGSGGEDKEKAKEIFRRKNVGCVLKVLDTFEPF